MLSYQITGEGIRIWENRGDGTFRLVDSSVIEDFGVGTGLGLSFADWDNDGDLDMTSRSVFRESRFVETGSPHFARVALQIPNEHKGDSTPAWGDTDHDGDLDCALGNFGESGTFLENTLHDYVPFVDRSYLRVRPVRDSATVPQGLDTEFGAIADLFVRGDAPGFRRRLFASSSAGYLNQGEYPLHFGLPRPDAELDVGVDFPSDPARGPLACPTVS